MVCNSPNSISIFISLEIYKFVGSVNGDVYFSLYCYLIHTLWLWQDYNIIAHNIHLASYNNCHIIPSDVIHPIRRVGAFISFFFFFFFCLLCRLPFSFVCSVKCYTSLFVMESPIQSSQNIVRKMKWKKKTGKFHGIRQITQIFDLLTDDSLTFLWIGFFLSLRFNLHRLNISVCACVSFSYFIFAPSNQFQFIMFQVIYSCQCNFVLRCWVFFRPKTNSKQLKCKINIGSVDVIDICTEYNWAVNHDVYSVRILLFFFVHWSHTIKTHIHLFFFLFFSLSHPLTHSLTHSSPSVKSIFIFSIGIIE